MKKILLLSIITIFLSCSKTANFDKLEVGMTSKEVIDLVGEPTEKTDFLGAKVWVYKEGDVGHMVTILADTVFSEKSSEEIAEFYKKIEEKESK